MTQTADDSLRSIRSLYESNYYDEDNLFSYDDDDEEEARIIPPEVEDTKSWFKARYIFAFLGFLGFANVYAMRVNLSVAIVAMVTGTNTTNSSDVITDVCPEYYTNTTAPTHKGEFDWDEETQGIVLGSFFYGYVLTQIPGGRLAEMYGGKNIFGFGILITAIFTLLSPIAARTSYPLFILVRIMEGIGEGVTFPAMYAMLARWIPPWERSKFAAIVYQGSFFGTVISLPLSGWLCDLKYDNGWPLAFYIFGVLGLIWFLFWMWLAYDTPSQHPRIDPQERMYILSGIGEVQDGSDDGPTPWLKILTSGPVWAILVTQCGQSWMFYTQLTEMPTYMKNMLHFSIQDDALYSAIPYFTSWISGLLFSSFADWLLLKGCLSPITSFKLFNTIACVFPSLCVLGVAWAGCDQFTVQVLLAVAGAFTGAAYAGYQNNHMALSLKYAATMYGITNGAANICGFVAPYVTGMIIKGNQTLGQWRLVFYLSAGVNIATNLFYLQFSSARERPWSKGVQQPPPPEQEGNIQGN